MTEEEAANWRDLCNAALTARDPDRLIEIIRKLNAALDREEKDRRSRAQPEPVISNRQRNHASELAGGLK